MRSGLVSTALALAGAVCGHDATGPPAARPPLVLQDLRDHLARARGPVPTGLAERLRWEDALKDARAALQGRAVRLSVLFVSKDDATVKLADEWTLTRTEGAGFAVGMDYVGPPRRVTIRGEVRVVGETDDEKLKATRPGTRVLIVGILEDLRGTADRVEVRLSGIRQVP